MEVHIGKGAWNESEERGRLNPRSKLNKKQSTIGTHETVVYGPMVDWKKQKRLDYKRDVCDALVTSRPWNDFRE